jgi:hypothetical protein
LNDYPEDRALLARKAQKAAKEMAEKQAQNTEQQATTNFFSFLNFNP